MHCLLDVIRTRCITYFGIISIRDGENLAKIMQGIVEDKKSIGKTKAGDIFNKVQERILTDTNVWRGVWGEIFWE